jgi:hypothetical protein
MISACSCVHRRGAALGLFLLQATAGPSCLLAGRPGLAWRVAAFHPPIVCACRLLAAPARAPHGLLLLLLLLLSRLTRQLLQAIPPHHSLSLGLSLLSFVPAPPTTTHLHLTPHFAHIQQRQQHTRSNNDNTHYSLLLPRLPVPLFVARDRSFARPAYRSTHRIPASASRIHDPRAARNCSNSARTLCHWLKATAYSPSCPTLPVSSVTLTTHLRRRRHEFRIH